MGPQTPSGSFSVEYDYRDGLDINDDYRDFVERTDETLSFIAPSRWEYTPYDNTIPDYFDAHTLTVEHLESRRRSLPHLRYKVGIAYDDPTRTITAAFYYAGHPLPLTLTATAIAEPFDTALRLWEIDTAGNIPSITKLRRYPTSTIELGTLLCRPTHIAWSFIDLVSRIERAGYATLSAPAQETACRLAPEWNSTPEDLIASVRFCLAPANT